MLLKIGYRLTVDLHDLERTWLLNQVLGHDTHSRPHFQHGNLRAGIYRIGYRLGDIQVSQEMLTKVFLGSNLFHGGKITIFFSFIQKKTGRIHILPAFLYAFFSLTFVT